MPSESDWTSGYVTELEYTHGYYRELSPGILRLACLSAGVAMPAGNALNYLELGFGQGLSINVHAASNRGVYWGTDFNPTQAAHAATLAQASGSGATLLDDSFAELLERPDMPQFDLIVLHGIWTWISDENRRVIVELIRRKLRVGGVVYLSYNCFPGWAPAEPLRHLMTLHSDLAGSDATGTVGKIEGALKFAQDVSASGALYFRANPAVAERLKRITEQNRNYLAHEYFNRDWDLMAFSEVARRLDEAKLGFVASAHLLDHVDAVNLSGDGQKLLAGISHPILRQSVRDYLVNQQFRRDIFVRGARRLTPLEQGEALRAEKFVLGTVPEDVPLKVNGALGEATLQEGVYRPVLDALAAGSFAPKSMDQLIANPLLKSLQFSQIFQAVIVLVGGGYVYPAQEAATKQRTQCRALNRHLALRARSHSDIGFLASPVTGAGVAVPRFHQLFLLALQDGKKSEQELVSFVWNTISGQGQRIQKEGKALMTPEENIAELTGMVRQFNDKRLAILKALEVA